MSETYPTLDASADQAPHDEWCTKLLKGAPDDLKSGCLCKVIGTIRADEAMKIDKMRADAADMDAFSEALGTRLVQHLITALLPSGGAK